jgi:hypothetical protein
VVERTAHNGFVVGSNPTKLIFYFINFMKLNSKIYKINKTKNLTKTNSLFFIYNGINQKATDWINVEQKLININFKYYKVFNKVALKTFENSIFKNSKFTINSTTFFIKPSLNDINLKKHILINNFESLLFKLLAIKLNNKIYSIKQLNKTYSMTYKNNKILLYQFMITNLKIHFIKKYGLNIYNFEIM